MKLIKILFITLTLFGASLAIRKNEMKGEKKLNEKCKYQLLGSECAKSMTCDVAKDSKEGICKTISGGACTSSDSCQKGIQCVIEKGKTSGFCGGQSANGEKDLLQECTTKFFNLSDNCKEGLICKKQKDGKRICKFKLYKMGCKKDEECAEGICFGAPEFNGEWTSCMDMDHLEASNLTKDMKNKKAK